jgi:D-ribose pyranase
MRSDGIWHPRIAALTCSLMHGDLLVLADAAFPLPRDVEVIDLGWARRQPRLLPVLAAVCSELYVEAAYVAEELADTKFRAGLTAALASLESTAVPYEELRRMARTARAAIRTGEDTPFSNVILQGGCDFPATPT